ncbi:MAG: 4-(cytidine 5'-diphospho)-2-C-methyl-D-erythritol kinase [Chloroflexi bacterium RBG_16_48_7]|nr:MAG: 4-(cytidine 5'-diphospho)-2-C-methyl-D-erythritol kinase [Chloroflexi bacterium RBG_16_48_7]
MLTIRTPAKINLVLEATGKRPDGYHEIKSIIQSIDLYDELSFKHAPAIELECNTGGLPTDNLVARAARLIQGSQGYDSGALIKLKKRIPVSGGLGGGSSDAAATLIGLNQLWKLGLDEQALMILAAQLGSDVPFFVHRGTALAEGRGEKIAMLPGITGGWLVLVLSEELAIENKTAAMYLKLLPPDFTDGSRAQKMASDLRAGKGLDESLLFNAFDRAAKEYLRGVGRAFDRLLDAGASYVHVAGSGPTVFALTEDERSAAKLVSALGSDGRKWSYLMCQFTDK